MSAEKKVDSYKLWFEKESPWKKAVLFPLPLLAAAAFVVMCVAFYHWVNPKTVGKVTGTQMEVVRYARGDTEFLKEENQLFYQDKIEVGEKLGKLWFKLKNDTKLVADSGSKLELLDRNKISLKSGRLWAKTPQDLVVLVPEGKVEAIEAEFILEISQEQTIISVIEASTPIDFEINGKTVQIGAGQVCQAPTGKFPHQPTPAGYISIVWTEPGRISDSNQVDLSQGSQLSGTLMDLQGDLVEGSVYLISKDSGDSRTATSDQQGNYSISAIKPGNYLIHVKASGYRSQMNYTIPFPDKPSYMSHSFVLEKSNSIRLRILDTYDRIVPETEITVKDSQDRLVPRYNIWPEPNGGTTITDLDPGRYKVIITKPGYAGRVLRDVPVDSDLIFVTLRPAGKIAGKVVRNLDSTPVKEFSIRISSFEPAPETPETYHKDWKEFETKKGQFRLEGLNPGSYTLTVIHPDLTPVALAQIPVSSALTTSGLEFRMAEGGTITGVVRDRQTGKPVPSAKVSLYQYELNELDRLINGSGHTALSDEKGHFTIGHVPGGDVRLTVSSPDHLITKTGFINVSSGNETRADIMLEPGAQIKGKLLDSQGRSIADQQVKILDINNSGSITSTDNLGQYSFTHLKPGTYTIVTGNVQGQAGQIRLTKEITGVDNIVINLQFPSGSTVSGNVKTDRGDPLLASVNVATIGDNSFILAKTTFTNNTGRYILSDIPPGSYSISIEPFDPADQHRETLTVLPGKNLTKDFTLPQSSQSQ